MSNLLNGQSLGFSILITVISMLTMMFNLFVAVDSSLPLLIFARMQQFSKLPSV